MDANPTVSKDSLASAMESPGTEPEATPSEVVTVNATTGHRGIQRKRVSRKLVVRLRQSAESTSSVQSALAILRSNVQSVASGASPASPLPQDSPVEPS